MSSVQLVVTSPPYHIGKEYDLKCDFDVYLEDQRKTILECWRALSDTGSLCWQVGNYVKNGEILPLDIPVYQICHDFGMKLRNRIIWTFSHGLHCTHRLSHRYETIMWFTKSDNYVFNLDAIRVPQKYSRKKFFKGPKKGQLSCNPLGKNPTDIWEVPNVKHNHCEKTEHPCQFPVELIERLILALTNEDDLVIDPFAGVASSLCAAILHGRRYAGSEINEKYVEIGRERMQLAREGKLRTRPMGRPIHDPSLSSKV